MESLYEMNQNEKFNFNIDVSYVLREFSNLVECLCAAGYMRLGEPIQIVTMRQLSGGGVTLGDQFIIPIDDPTDVERLQKRIVEEVEPTWIIKKSQEYYEKTNIDPFDAVVWIDWEKGCGFRDKTEAEKSVTQQLL